MEEMRWKSCLTFCSERAQASGLLLHFAKRANGFAAGGSGGRGGGAGVVQQEQQVGGGRGPTTTGLIFKPSLDGVVILRGLIRQARLCLAFC